MKRCLRGKQADLGGSFSGYCTFSSTSEKVILLFANAHCCTARRLVETPNLHVCRHQLNANICG